MIAPLVTLGMLQLGNMGKFWICKAVMKELVIPHTMYINKYMRNICH